MDNVTIAIPSGQRPRVLREMWRGLWRRRHDDPVDEEAALEYFRQRSCIDQFDDFTDSNDSWYLTPLDQSLALQKALDRSPAILDIGCGRGGLLQWLPERLRPLYLGIDQDPGAIKTARRRYPEASFQTLDIRTDGGLTGRRPFGLVFLINVLPYVKDAVGLLERCREFCPNGLIAIHDPVPGPYWETEFGGFRILLRRPEAIQEIGGRCGWRVHDRIDLAFAQVFGQPVFPLAALTVMTSIAEPSRNGARNHVR